MYFILKLRKDITNNIEILIILEKNIPANFFRGDLCGRRGRQNFLCCTLIRIFSNVKHTNPTQQRQSMIFFTAEKHILPCFSFGLKFLSALKSQNNRISSNPAFIRHVFKNFSL